jgi:hypothetical protein
MQQIKKKVQSAKDILSSANYIDRLTENNKYVNKEFQEYGLRLATNLNDEKSKPLYIKLAKEVPRKYLEQAFTFTLDYPNVKNKGKIFMWKLTGICKENKYKMTFYRKKKTSKKVSPQLAFGL